MPPLQYNYVYQIKAQYPDLPIIINGQINTLEDVQQHMRYVDGVMIGRLACKDPYALAMLESFFCPHVIIRSRYNIAKDYFYYLQAQDVNCSQSFAILLKPLYNFAHGLPAAKHFKQLLLVAQTQRSMIALLDAINWLSY